jgi:hypothetical protein
MKRNKFAIDLLGILKQEKVIINYDESIIGRKIKVSNCAKHITMVSNKNLF